MGLGDYEKIENDRRRAFKLKRSLYDADARAASERLYEELSVRHERYLHDLLAQLPFSWHVEHAYTPRETAMYGGADHIIVDEEIKIGRFVRKPGDALSRTRSKFWGLAPVEEGRLPTSLADIKIAERIAAALPQNACVPLDRIIVPPNGHPGSGRGAGCRGTHARSRSASTIPVLGARKCLGWLPPGWALKGVWEVISETHAASATLTVLGTLPALAARWS